jgi:hypothetical protein
MLRWYGPCGPNTLPVIATRGRRDEHVTHDFIGTSNLQHTVSPCCSPSPSCTATTYARLSVPTCCACVVSKYWQELIAFVNTSARVRPRHKRCQSGTPHPAVCARSQPPHGSCLRDFTTGPLDVHFLLHLETVVHFAHVFTPHPRVTSTSWVDRYTKRNPSAVHSAAPGPWCSISCGMYGLPACTTVYGVSTFFVPPSTVQTTVVLICLGLPDAL